MIKKPLEAAGVYCCLSLCILIFLYMGGCSGNKVPTDRPNIPEAVESFTVPLNDTATKPNVICLTPGQTAMLLEPIEAKARVPYDSGELYEGTVRFEQGSMVVKPRVE